MSIDPSNAAQLANWDGDAGAFWTDNAGRFDRGVAAYRSLFLDAAAIEETMTVLDVGCGSGQSTRDAARLARGGSALGVDLSSRMIALARRRAEEEHLGNATFVQADVQVHPFSPQSVDVALSRHGAMFFGDPVAAFTNIARAMRPGGRLVLLTWQAFERNEFIHAILTALTVTGQVPVPGVDAPSPVALSDPARIHALLGAAGFIDVELESVQRPMNFGPDPDEAFSYLSEQYADMVCELDPDTRACAHERLHASLTEHHTDRGVLYDSAAWLIRARRS